MRYWLIYKPKHILSSYKALSFTNLEEMEEWANERKNEYDFVDIAKSISTEED